MQQSKMVAEAISHMRYGVKIKKTWTTALDAFVV